MMRNRNDQAGRNVDEEYANDIVRRNAEKYLGVEKLTDGSV